MTAWFLRKWTIRRYHHHSKRIRFTVQKLKLWHVIKIRLIRRRGYELTDEVQTQSFNSATQFPLRRPYFFTSPRYLSEVLRAACLFVCPFVRSHISSITWLMTTCMRQIAAPIGRQTTFFGRDRQVEAPEANSAVTIDCILLSMQVNVWHRISIRRLRFLIWRVYFVEGLSSASGLTVFMRTRVMAVFWLPFRNLLIPPFSSTAVSLRVLQFYRFDNVLSAFRPLFYCVKLYV